MSSHEEITFGGESTQEAPSTNDAYVILNADGEVIDRPIERLGSVEARCARALNEKSISGGNSQAMAEWWLRYTGFKNGVLNRLSALAWIKTIKGFMPTRVSQLFSFAWETNEETGKKQPVGKPLAYRAWCVVPFFNGEPIDLTTRENVELFDSGQAKITARVMPVASAIGLEKSKAKLTDRKGSVIKHDVPRILSKNMITVSVEQNEDGSFAIREVRANYYMRLNWRNKNYQTPDANGVSRASKLYAAASNHSAFTCTNEFLAVFNETDESKDINARIHETLMTFMSGRAGTDSVLYKVMQLQGRSAIGAYVDSLPKGKGELTDEFNLIDRCCMYAVDTYDHYHGVEYVSDNTDNEYVDFHCKVAELFDPVEKRANGVAGHERVNKAFRITLFR